MINCKVCDKPFDSERGLHAHLKKHNLTVAEYYTKYFPRKNLLTGKFLPFKNKKDYFSKDFSNRIQMIKWLNSVGEVQAKQYVIKKFLERIKDKNVAGFCRI